MISNVFVNQYCNKNKDHYVYTTNTNLVIIMT